MSIIRCARVYMFFDARIRHVGFSFGGIPRGEEFP